MSSVRQAFDRHAPVYDQVFSNQRIRSEVWEIADRVFLPGMQLLDLGCGTGEDAIHFAQRGLKVTAVDISSRMIDQLKRKGAQGIHCEEADMRTYVTSGTRFNGIFSNFGALNCVSDLSWLKRITLAPHAQLVLTTMGRLYPLESFVFLLTGQPRLVFRRLCRSCEAVVEGVRFNVYYHGLRSIQKELESKFELTEIRGLRSLLPAPGFEHLEQFRVFRLLAPLDRWLTMHRPTAAWSDHFVSVWKCREQ